MSMSCFGRSVRCPGTKKKNKETHQTDINVQHIEIDELQFTQPTYTSPPFFRISVGEWAHNSVTIKSIRNSITYQNHKFMAANLLLKELNHCSKLRYPNLLAILAYNKDAHSNLPSHLIFDHTLGSLNHLMHIKQLTIDVKDACDFGGQIALALNYLHSQNLTHNCVTSHAVHLVTSGIKASIKLTELAYMTPFAIDHSDASSADTVSNGTHQTNLTTLNQFAGSKISLISNFSNNQHNFPANSMNHFLIPQQFWRWLPGEVFLENENLNVTNESFQNKSFKSPDSFGWPLNKNEKYRTPKYKLTESSRKCIAIDIYGLSTILWEMLCGREPWSGKQPDEVREILKSKRLHVPPPLDDQHDVLIPMRLQDLLRKGLARQATKRVQNMEMYYNELQKIRSFIQQVEDQEAEVDSNNNLRNYEKISKFHDQSTHLRMA